VSILQLLNPKYDHHYFFVLTPDGIITEWLCTEDSDAHRFHSLEEADLEYEQYIQDGYVPTENLIILAYTLDSWIRMARDHSAEWEEELKHFLAQWKVIHDLIASQPGGHEFLNRF
jgi:hypothetical protein